jgi:hypothetical protein
VSTPRDLLDRMIRDTLRYPEHLHTFLRQVVPHLAEGFDYRQVTPVGREFFRSDWHGREADLPFTIPYRWGDTEVLALVFLLIEHQSDTDPLMPLRLLFFLTGYWERQWAEWEQLKQRPRPPLRLHPVLPIVLYTGPVPWGSNRTLDQLLGEPQAFHAFAPRWEPLFWNLADRTPEQLLDSHEDWLQPMAAIRAQDEEGPRFLDICERAYVHLRSLGEQDRVRWDQLTRMIRYWGVHCRPNSEQQALHEVAEASQTDSARRREIQQMGQTIAEAMEARGAIKESRNNLRALLESKFGTLPEPLIQQLDGTDDLAKLRAAFQRALSIDKLDDLSF